MTIVNKTTLQIVQENEFRNLYKNISFPTIITASALEGFDYVVIDEPEYPTLNKYESANLEAYRYGGQVRLRWKVIDNRPTNDQLINQYENAIDAMLDAKAREYKYNNVYTMISYRNDPNPKFANEAESMFQWRSKVWTKANEILEQYLTNTNQTIPDVDNVILQLPVFELIN